MGEDIKALVEELCEAAMDHGWAQDQGYGDHPGRAVADYVAAKQKLLDAISRPQASASVEEVAKLNHMLSRAKSDALAWWSHAAKYQEFAENCPPESVASNTREAVLSADRAEEAELTVRALHAAVLAFTASPSDAQPAPGSCDP